MDLYKLERLTWGKTHYFDPGTRRWFGARFSDFWAAGADSASEDGREVVVSMIESVAPPGDVRKYRPCVLIVPEGRVCSLDALGAPTNEILYLTRYEAKRRLELARRVAMSLERFFRGLAS